MAAIIDNNYINGPPVQAFEANITLAEDLKEVGLKFRPVKSKCYIDSPHQGEAWDRMRGKIHNGVLKTVSGEAICMVSLEQKQFSSSSRVWKTSEPSVFIKFHGGFGTGVYQA